MPRNVYDRGNHRLPPLLKPVTIGDLTLLPVPKVNRSQVHDSYEDNAIPDEVRCSSSSDGGGFTEEDREGEMVGINLAVFDDRDLIGGASIIGIQLLEQNGRTLTVEGMFAPALPDMGSEEWTVQTFEIMSGLLDTPLPREDGLTLVFSRFLSPENYTDAFVGLPRASDKITDAATNAAYLATLNITTTVSNRRMEDGRRIVYFERL